MQIFSFKFSNVCPSPMVIKLRVQRHFHIVADFFAVCLLCVNVSIFMRVISCIHKIFHKYFKKFIAMSEHFCRYSWEWFCNSFMFWRLLQTLTWILRGNSQILLEVRLWNTNIPVLLMMLKIFLLYFWMLACWKWVRKSL